jgi:hypothetical protein
MYKKPRQIWIQELSVTSLCLLPFSIRIHDTAANGSSVT